MPNCVKTLVDLFCMGNASGGWKSRGTKVRFRRSFKFSNQVSRGGGGTNWGT
jgi:hypothetical protein